MEFPLPRSSKSQPPTTNSSSPASSPSSTDSEHEIGKKLKQLYAIEITPLHHEKFPDNQVAASESSPPQQSRGRRGSNTTSDDDSDSANSSKRSAPYDGLLMRESNLDLDPEWKLRHQAARRRLKKAVFGPHDVDWKILPAVEEFDCTWFKGNEKLSLHPGWRCIASQQYLRQILAAQPKTQLGRASAPRSMGDEWHWRSVQRGNTGAAVYVDSAQLWSKANPNGLGQISTNSDEAIDEADMIDMIG